MKKKGIQKSLRVLCMLLCFFAMMAVRVSAAEEYGQGQKGSLSVVMKNRKTNTKIPGGEVVLYQVAEFTSNETEIQYTFTNGFENCGLKLDNLEDELLAEKLKAEINASTVGVAQTIGTDGTAGFSGLEEGVYLVVQTKTAKGYEMFSPFLVSLPMMEDGQWKYQVEAMPKIEVSVSGKAETPLKRPVSTPKPAFSGNNLRLPQTGQLIWPIPVMAIAGMLLFAVGWSLRKDKKTE